MNRCRQPPENEDIVFHEMRISEVEQWGETELWQNT